MVLTPSRAAQVALSAVAAAGASATGPSARRVNVPCVSTGSPRVVYENGRYNGRTLAEWLPDVVASISERFDPLKIIVFGSLARDEHGPDSDIDLMVVLQRVEDKRETAIAVRRAVDEPVPVDIFVTDPEEIARRGHVIGSALEAALHEGKVVYERS